MSKARHVKSSEFTQEKSKIKDIFNTNDEEFLCNFINIKTKLAMLKSEAPGNSYMKDMVAHLVSKNVLCEIRSVLYQNNVVQLKNCPIKNRHSKKVYFVNLLPKNQLILYVYRNPELFLCYAVKISANIDLNAVYEISLKYKVKFIMQEVIRQKIIAKEEFNIEKYQQMINEIPSLSFT